MNKKKLILFLTALFALAGPKIYARNLNVRTDEQKVTVSVDAQKKSSAMLLMIEKGGSVEKDSDVYAIKEAEADDDGKIVFTYSIPDTEREYEIYVKIQNGDKLSGQLVYVPKEKVNAVAEALSEAFDEEKHADSEALAAVFDNADYAAALKMLGINLDLYSGQSDEVKEEAMTRSYTLLKNKTDLEEVTAGLNHILSMTALNSDSEAASDKYIKGAGLSFEGKTYDELEDTALKDYIVNYMYKNRKYISDGDYTTAYSRANALYILKNTRFDEMQAVLTKYCGTLGITSSEEYTKYLGLSDKTQTNKSLVSNLKNNAVYTVSEFLKQLSASIVINDGGSGSGGSGGSGGGSSSGSGVAFGEAVPSVDAPATALRDIDEVAWAKAAISELHTKGIVSGDENGYFNPNDSVTREQFIKMIVTAMNLVDENAKCSFDDVLPGAWYYKYIASAYNAGIVNGVSESEFGTGAEITRQDMAVMCFNAAKKYDLLASYNAEFDFADSADIAEYAKEAVGVLVNNGIINGVGDNMFAPRQTASRAQSAVIIHNLLK